MIELAHDQLIFRFPDVHPDAELTVDFQRTLRIPDDERAYPLPPGLGRFPLRPVDDFAPKVPRRWIEHGGVMLPMYQSEALWINFRGHYPFAVKVATGLRDAITGQPLTAGLSLRPQNYLVTPDQPWLDGFCVEKGVIRQFVAMPLGSGYSVEEQLTGQAEHGGLQLVVHPIKASVYERMINRRVTVTDLGLSTMVCESRTMGLAPGGRMRQEVYRDRHALASWDQGHTAQCFVHLANALVWRAITGDPPPTVPPTAAEYTRAGLPWFEYYAHDLSPLDGAPALAGLQSVAQLGHTAAF